MCLDKTIFNVRFLNDINRQSKLLNIYFRRKVRVQNLLVIRVYCFSHRLSSVVFRCTDLRIKIFKLDTGIRSMRLFGTVVNQFYYVKETESENGLSKTTKVKTFNNKDDFFNVHFRNEKDFQIPKFISGDRYPDNKDSNFVKTMALRLKIGLSYSLLFKLKYKDSDGNILYSMLGRQIGLFTKHSDNKEDVVEQLCDIQEVINKRLEEFDEEYVPLVILAIQVMSLENDSLPQLKYKNIDNLSFDKKLINVNKTRAMFNERFIPLTMDERYYGTLLQKKLCDSENKIVKVLLQDGTDILAKILDNFNKSKVYNSLYKLNLADELFTATSTNYYFRSLNDKGSEGVILMVAFPSIIDGKKYIWVFSAQSGLVIKEGVVDRISGIEQPNSFTRIYRETEVDIINGEPVQNRVKIKLPALRVKKEYNPQFIADTRIGSFDLETFLCEEESVNKIYSVGFTNVNLVKEEDDNLQTKLFYLTRDGDTPNKLLDISIHEMFKNNNHNHIYYTHNLGGYDAIFILNFLLNENIIKDTKYYYISNQIFRDEKILKFTLRIPSVFKNKFITFVDSYNLLTASLDDLSKAFGSNIKKGIFPHLFVNKQTLNFVGNTPDIYYYDNKIKPEDYNIEIRDNWSLREENLKYLKRDLLSLLEIMENFIRQIFLKYGVQVTQCLTISRLALTIYMKKYYPNSLPLPVINHKGVFSNIKKALYGGVVEVYRPYGEKIFLYDVNSLYPFASLNDMPGRECKFISGTKSHPLKLKKDNLFGFFYCKIKSNDGYLGLLPVHTKSGSLIMPNGEWWGWYYSEELKFAMSHGYEVTPYKGYIFNRVSGIFSNFVKDIYHVKANSEGSLKLISKLILNSLLGRFGLDIFKPRTEIVSYEEYKEILATKRLISYKKITERDYIVSFDREVSHKVCHEHGLDYIQVLNHNSQSDMENINQFDDVAVSVSAAVTANARVYMAKVKLLILKKRGRIYYSDTDSLGTDIHLPEELVGKELGKFKKYPPIKRAFFISSKIYCLEFMNGETLIKAKGVSERDDITIEDFERLYNNHNIKVKNKESKKDYYKGSVVLQDNFMELKYDSYTKREKIYKTAKDGTQKWVDTRPVRINIPESHVDI